MKLPAEVAGLMERIRQAGHEVFVVGGAVRDMFLGRPVNDFDLAASALPDEVVRLFPDCDPNQVGKQFGVVLVRGVEIATYRTEAYGGNGRRDCVVSRASSIEEDLSRRDFTVNAMALDPLTGRLVDPHGGRQDLARRVIRFVGDPFERLQEDPVRALRACRFAARRGWTLDPQAVRAIRQKAEIVSALPGERVRLELLKVLKFRQPSRFFSLLRETHLLEKILPEMVSLVDHPGGPHHGEDVFTHCLLVGDALPRRDPILRLVGFLHDLGKPFCFDGEGFPGHAEVGAQLAEQCLSRLRFSKVETTRVAALVGLHMQQIPTTPKGLRRFLHRLQTRGVTWQDWLRLRLADSRGNLAKSVSFVDSLTLIRRFQQAERELVPPTKLAVTGRDVMQVLNIPPGPRVGEVLKALHQFVLDEGPEVNIRQTLLERLMTWRR